MKIKVEELCMVDYINEKKEQISDKELYAKRICIYDSEEEDLIAAYQDFMQNFDSDKLIYCKDDFEGACLDTVKVLNIAEYAEEI